MKRFIALLASCSLFAIVVPMSVQAYSINDHFTRSYAENANLFGRRGMKAYSVNSWLHRKSYSRVVSFYRSALDRYSIIPSLTVTGAGGFDEKNGVIRPSARAQKNAVIGAAKEAIN